MCLLDENEDRVLELIEDGSLCLAFDIASPGSSRREIRIWREALVARLTDQPQPKLARTLRPIVEEMIPGKDIPGREVVHREVQRILACSGTHVTDLVRLEALFAVGPRPVHSCTSHMTRIARVSLAAFLERRIIR
jgi:hypothetical protein